MENSNEKILLDVKDVQSYLYETAKWAKFIAIVGYVFLGLLAILMLFYLFMGVATIYYGQYGGIIFIIWYALVFALYFFPITYLYRFATKMEKGLRTRNEQFVIDSFSNLKSHYKFVGILLAITLVLYLLIIIVAILR